MPAGAYLDWNATAPLRPEARAALSSALDLLGNPSSVHGFGRRARKVVEDARESVAALVGAVPADVIFTAGGTEANNLALGGTGLPRRLVLATEHASVLDVEPEAGRVPVTGDGLIDLPALDAMLAAGGAALVSVQAVNNETGVIQPLDRVAAIVHARGGLLHSDAVQAAGRLPLDMAAGDVDLLTLSAHKIGGPQGVGALVVRPGVPLAPLLRGGGQERRRRAGTENVAGIAGFGAAAAAARQGLADYAGIARLRDRIEAAAGGVPGTVVFGAGAPRVANTSCVALPGVPAESQLMALDLAGIAVSTGAACSSGTVRVSHVLTAMGADPALARCAIRVSLGWTTTEAEADRFIEAWRRLAAKAARAA